MKTQFFGVCSCVIIMMLSLSKTDSNGTQRAECGMPVILLCPIAHGARYLRITWYKVINGSHLNVLISSNEMKDSRKASTDGKFEMDDNESLIIREIQVEDAGMYRCALRAPLGARNLELESKLIVPECPTLKPPTSDGTLHLDFSPSKTNAPNFTCCKGEPLPFLPSVLLLLFLSLGKALASSIVCLVAVKVIKLRINNQTKKNQWKKV
ncbi:hypothetical protein NDU88_001792 [Pleurodeles waltl]|uniref:Ig-like domain-containing protein n=1 Tax=Pleurodeles waltl TaxID=8319 RepID=A0AAV7P4V8_PLEWA|nr:hypothetical protein NDU88_001792 [Pleurodeles waltl]